MSAAPAAGFTRGEQASWGAPGSTATASHHQQETTCQRATEKASRRGLLSPQRGGSRRLNEGSRRIGAIALPSKTGLGGLFSERPQFREHPPPLGHPAPFLRRPRSLGASSRTVMGRAAHLRTGGVKTGRKTKRSAKPRSSSSTGSRASGSSVGWSDGSPRVGRKPPARSLDRPASRKHTRRVAPRVRCLRRAWIAPDASGAMFLGATSDDGVTIQLPLLQVRSGIRMGTTATAPDEAVDVLKAIRGQGNAVLQGSTHAPAFDWFGSAEEILVRLRSLPEDGGPEMIRSEFA